MSGYEICHRCMYPVSLSGRKLRPVRGVRPRRILCDLCLARNAVKRAEKTLEEKRAVVARMEAERERQQELYRRRRRASGEREEELE